MKLPEDKDQRNKVLGAIGVGIIGLSYVAFTFGISPFFEKQKATEERIVELKDTLWKSKKATEQAPLSLTQNNITLSNILHVSESKGYILRPSLGNYLLVATDVLTRHADAIGLEIEKINATKTVRAADKTDANKPDPNGPRFNAYAVNVSLNCNLLDLMRLVKALEESNPYLCITRMGVFSNPQDFEKHSVSFDVEWPIWIDNDTPVKLYAEKLSDEERL